MRKLFQIFLLFFVGFSLFFPMIGFGSIEFYEVFPNTIDDTNLEYISFRNTGCDTVYFSGFSLSDESGKYYYFTADTILGSHTNVNISRTISKIILNNTDEILYLKDGNGDILSQFAYPTSIKGIPIMNNNITDDVCGGEIYIGSTDNNSGSIESETGAIDDSSTGSVLDGSGIIDNTGAVIDTGTGELVNGTGDSIDDSTGIIVDTTTPLQNNSNDETVYITGVLFPEIIPTIQHPTNATFSSGYFDCQNLNPCRINITFDPIFSSGFNSKDYICEIITETGTLFDCNPNTLYYTASGNITLKLSHKVEINQSKSITWQIKYREIINETNNTGAIENDTHIGSGTSDIIFPEIIPTFQNYTNTIFTGGNILICHTTPCRVNMNFENIFTGSFLGKNYICEITHQGQIYDCNPPQLYLNGSGNIDIRLIEKLTRQYKIVTYTYNSIISNDSTEGIGKNPTLPIQDNNPPIAILEYDGKMKDYHEQIGEYEMNCYTDTCAINLTAEKSYDQEGGKIDFIWYYGFNDIKTTKDPGERKYSIGDHQIWLRVIDSSGNVTHIRYYIHVLGKRTVPIESPKIREKMTKEKSLEKKSKKKKIKKIKMKFFDAPEVVLQKSKFLDINNAYICKTTTKKCSLNLKIQSPQKGVIYRWIYSDGTIIDSSNPKSKALDLGRHSVRIIAGYNLDSPIWTKAMEITVQKITKPKKKKTKKTAKIDQFSGSNKEKSITKVHQLSQIDTQKNTSEFPISVLAFFGGLVPIYWIRKYQNNIKDKNIENNRQ